MCVEVESIVFTRQLSSMYPSSDSYSIRSPVFCFPAQNANTITFSNCRITAPCSTQWGGSGKCAGFCPSVGRNGEVNGEIFIHSAPHNALQLSIAFELKYGGYCGVISLQRRYDAIETKSFECSNPIVAGVTRRCIQMTQFL